MWLIYTTLLIYTNLKCDWSQSLKTVKGVGMYIYILSNFFQLVMLTESLAMLGSSLVNVFSTVNTHLNIDL
jgi:hypothetical protein